MNEGSVFRDYYKILEVDPSCNGKTLEASYRLLAKLYHPDHPETADVSRFNDVIQAYRALRDSDQRTAYDRVYRCGSSAVRGGAVSGIPGHNAAKKIFEDLRR